MYVCVCKCVYIHIYINMYIYVYFFGADRSACTAPGGARRVLARRGDFLEPPRATRGAPDQPVVVLLRAKICSDGVAIIAFASLVGAVALPRGSRIGASGQPFPRPFPIASISGTLFPLRRDHLPDPARRIFSQLQTLRISVATFSPLRSLA